MYTNIDIKIEQIKEQISKADSILIGAGSGLSTSAGFTYTNERFDKYFSDFKNKYGITDMYSGGFYPYETLEEYWAYWSRYIYINRYMNTPKKAYEELYEIVKNKDYFVLTTNVDHCFQKAGFDKNKLFYTQGDYGLFQCSTPCHNKTYDNKKIIEEMYKKQKNMKIPSNLIPLCPICKKPMTMNLRSDNTFVEDEGWNKAYNKYKTYIEKNRNKKLLLLELGVGYNTPSIIKYNFWNILEHNKNSFYISINKNDILPEELTNRSILIKQDIYETLKKINS